MATRRPDHIEALLTLGHILRELGEFEDALRILQRISELSPGHVNARAAYALTLFYKQDWTRAWQAFDVRFEFPDVVANVTLSAQGRCEVSCSALERRPSTGLALGAGRAGTR